MNIQRNHRMKIAVCTLFEGNYHYGVAVLVNSLCSAGFQGTFYAGFRGDLPSWVKLDENLMMRVTEKILLQFIPLETTSHLTNYKPDFMLDLLDEPATEAEAVLYLDPDIVVNAPWRFFEEWLTCGVALCEDVNSPLSENHPRRIGWRRFYGTEGCNLKFARNEYVNGGCVGVHKTHLNFLLRWKSMQDELFEAIGGSHKAGIIGGERLTGATGFADCFGKTDQDVLNACIEHPKFQASILGQEAMAFKSGRAILPHALGLRKPWARPFIFLALLGSPPRVVDKAFWRYVDGPLRVFPKIEIWRKRITIQLLAFIGRFYRKG